ncbi:MAG: sugar phosphate isomerase/epimerase [Thermoguttaceae bacterium]|nr:sugar phosphate isomerase/epimerase [Thermoguttaceae bacterium]MDW8039376.1 sugar phosphate isomerase/epimerase [Thermoguttaceae bacterium]
MRQVHRREVLELGGLFLAAAGSCGWGWWKEARVAEAAEKLAEGAPHAEKLGWRLGCQAYSFNRFTFFEAVDKTASLGLKVIEMYPGQPMSPDRRQIRVGVGMPKEAEKAVLDKLRSAGIKLTNYGVCGLPNDEKVCRETFEFARRMGIETLVSEPPFEAFDLLDKLVEEYKVNVAIHNHPKPSRYWDPQTVLKVCKDRSPRIGACADTGHWMRSEIKPLEAIRLLEGRIISFHFKDLNKFGPGAHDVPWGTGQADVPAILKEVRRQKIQAVFSIEYEHNWENSLPEIALCVKFFDKVAAELLLA